MKKIDEVTINGERIFLRKSFLGYSVVHPIKIDGKFNWKNFLAGGSWIKLIITLTLCFFLVMAIIEYSTAVRVANQCLEQLNFVKGIGFLK